MIFEQESFLDNHLCDYLINVHNTSAIDKIHRDTEILAITNYFHNNIVYRYCTTKCNYFAQKSFNDSDIFVNYAELVKWNKEGQLPHLDFPEHFCTSILYLNEDYEGGETIINGSVITPKKGKIVCFSGRNLLHSVNDIVKGKRYTLAFWYLNMKEIQFK